MPVVSGAGTIYFPTGAPLVNPALANTTTWFSEGLSSYNALQVDLNHRFSHGFQIRGVYTFSKSLDDGTALNSSVGSNAPGFVMYPLNPKAGLGAVDFERPQLGRRSRQPGASHRTWARAAGQRRPMGAGLRGRMDREWH